MATAHPPQPRGIDGLEGREPIGACLTVGTKGPKGNPIDRGKFYVKSPDMAGDGARPPHPAFRAFNENEGVFRQRVAGVLVHSAWPECFEFGLRAQVLPKHPTHPRKVPACVGDGVRAVRYAGTGEDGSHDFREIACPHDACEFRQGDPKPCKPWMRFLFRPIWPGEGKLPTPLMKFTSQSWNTVRNFVGFRDYVESQARSLGVTDWTWYGVTFEMTLTEKSDPSKKSRFPVVTITPTADVQSFLVAQRQMLRDVRQPLPVAITSRPVALLDAPQQEPETIAEDIVETQPGLFVRPS